MKVNSWYIVDKEAEKNIPRYTPNPDDVLRDGKFCPVKYFIWLNEMMEKYSGGDKCENS
jgi:hypothetical protein